MPAICAVVKSASKGGGFAEVLGRPVFRNIQGLSYLTPVIEGHDKLAEQTVADFVKAVTGNLRDKGLI